MTPDQVTALTVTVCVGYGLVLLSIPFLDIAGRFLLGRWVDRRRAANLDAAERRHQACDGRVYGEE